MYRMGCPFLGLEDIIIYASLVGNHIAFGATAVLVGNEMSKGTNLLPFLVYSNITGALALAPFAFFLEKNLEAKMSLTLLVRVFLISIGSTCGYQALMLIGMRKTSPSFVTAMSNLAPAIIFVMAWTLGMEKVDMKCSHSRLKVVGTVICVCGAMGMTLLQGPPLSQLWTSSQHSQNIIVGFVYESISDKRLVGCIYILSAVMMLSASMILQAEVVKKYPAPLSLTVITAALGAIQSAILILIVDKGIHSTSWILDWSGLFTVFCSGIVCQGVAVTLQLWCIQKRGPVFVSIFSPISTVCTAFLSSFFLGETLHLGSVIGVLLIFSGLYTVLWGKSKDYVNGKIARDEEEQFKSAADVRVALLD